jgi:microcystin-dependent protein
MANWSYTKLSEMIDRHVAGDFTLSPATFSLVLSALSAMECRHQWRGASGRLTDNEYDDVQAWVAQGYADLLHEVISEVSLPIGSIVSWIGKAGTTLPSGYLMCNGTEYDRADYPDLYDILDDSLIIDVDTFKTPDLSGRVVMGDSHDYALGDVGGEAEHILTIDEIPTHNHKEASGAYSGYGDYMGRATAASGDIYTDNTGGGLAHNNLQPYYATRWIIRAL